MSAPAIIYLALCLITLIVKVSRHGQPRIETYSAGYALLDASVALGLLYWGGFFGPCAA